MYILIMLKELYTKRNAIISWFIGQSKVSLIKKNGNLLSGFVSIWIHLATVNETRIAYTMGGRGNGYSHCTGIFMSQLLFYSWKLYQMDKGAGIP